MAMTDDEKLQEVTAEYEASMAMTADECAKRLLEAIGLIAMADYPYSDGITDRVHPVRLAALGFIAGIARGALADPPHFAHGLDAEKPRRRKARPKQLEDRSEHEDEGTAGMQAQAECARSELD